jgi:antitoxin VapB
VGLTIKNDEVERLATEVAGMTGETKTQAIRQSLRERRDRLALRIAPAALTAQQRRFLESEIWGDIPNEILDLPRDTAFEDEVLGYGSDGV